MASHPIYCAILYGGEFHDVTADVHQPSALRVDRGAQDETGGLRPGKVELTLKDIDQAAPKYDPDHPLSPLYGLAGRNSQMMLSTDLVTETFESAVPAIARVDAGSAFWTRSTTNPHTGTWSLKAGTISNSQVSDVTMTTPAGATTIQFWYNVSSASGDGLQVLVDGVNLAVNVAGVTGWVQKTYKVTPGGTVRFRYTKDAAGSGGSDTAWIDDVHFFCPRNTVELSSWQPDQTESFVAGLSGFRATDLQGEGVLRRLGRWTDSLRSPVYRQISARASTGRLMGYWPGEDQPGSTGLTNVVSGGQPGLATAVTYAGGVAMSGTDPLLKLGPTSKLSGRFLKPTGTVNGWQISWTFQFGTAPTATSQPLITWTSTNGYRWYINVTNTVYNVTVIAADGSTSLLSDSVLYSGTGDPLNDGMVFRVKVSAAAGTVTVETAWYSQDSPTVAGITSTFAGTTGNLLSWATNGNPMTDGMTFGQVYGMSSTVDDLQDYATIYAFNGYRGETAGDRFLRLTAGAGIVGLMIGNTADTQPMGPQKTGKVFDLLKEIQITEDGPMFEPAWRLGLYFRSRRSMYNQTAKLTLTRAQCAPPLRKVTDDLVTGNQITVKNLTGGEATVSVDTGPGSTLSPPSGVGLYEQTINVNVADDADLDEIAGWWANKLSDTTPRYPQVTVDLDAQPGLETAVNQVDIGDRIVLSDVVPGGVGLIVLGYSEQWTTQYRRKVTFVCGPDTLYNPAVYNAAAADYDALTTTLAVARDAVQTSWSITTTDANDVWSTTAVPYGWLVAGEQLTVTAMSAAAGSGPYTQTATVTRSVNGIAKPQAVGTEIHIYPIARYGR